MRPTLACCTLALLLAACASRPSPPLVEKVIATPKPVVHAASAQREIPKDSPRDSARDASHADPAVPAATGSDAVASVLYFGPDVYEVRDEDRPLLQAHAKRLLDHPDWHLLIEAHTDPIGAPDYNAELARMRALSVKKLLIGMGVPATQLETAAYGASSSGGKTHSSSARAASRRVDLKYRN